jgi:hypothetical protein
VIARLDRKREQATRRLEHVLTLDFADLACTESCIAAMAHCTGQELTPAWFERWQPINVQVDMTALYRYAVAHTPALAKLAAVASQTILAAFASRPVVSEAVTFQAEPLATVRREGEALIAAHVTHVGESPNDGQAKNWPLWFLFEQMNALEVMTARCNGRLLGYLMTVIGPSLEAEGQFTGATTAFYVTPDAPGVGIKLQRAAMASLRARGVHHAFLQAGIRGDGARLGAVYRRMGAIPAGEVFRLPLAPELEDAA